MNMRLVVLLFTVISFGFLTSCGGGGSKLSDKDSVDYRGTLLDSELVGTKNATFLIPYAVKAYKITYNSIDAAGNKTRASGLLAIPQKTSGEKSPLLSYQHGTIFLDDQAPSNSSTSVDAIMSFAGTGYIISAPDYIGYGESVGQIHPYLHADSLASASMDMLIASKAFLKSVNVLTNQQLFLAGYSEGGYATLAFQKAIQDDNGSELKVTASAVGAGPYDLTQTATILANKEINSRPAYMSFVLKAYDAIYNLDKISEMYQNQYVNEINTVFDGKHSSSYITDHLTTVTEELFKPDFLGVLRTSGRHVIMDKLALNNIYDWKPLAPTRFYHGQNDEVVPYVNSQKALESMRAKGATNVSLGDCVLDTHVRCAIPYVFDAIRFFDDYVEDL